MFLEKFKMPGETFIVETVDRTGKVKDSNLSTADSHVNEVIAGTKHLVKFELAKSNKGSNK